ncbi:MAG TPA: hypothetical protein VFO16_21590 [Pseudonocardiaceae bacterium]|nr:hypothetical protein [Pseudonocardiaceae bacterium]
MGTVLDQTGVDLQLGAPRSRLGKQDLITIPSWSSPHRSSDMPGSRFLAAAPDMSP